MRYALVLLLIMGCSRGDPRAARAPRVMELGREDIAVVTTDVVRSGPMISGTLVPVRNAQLRAQIGGSVVETLADAGQHVAANQVLARIDAAAVRDAYLSAKAAVSSAQLAAENADRQVKRYDTLLAAGAIAERDEEGIVEQDAQAKAGLANAQAALVEAEKALANTEIRSPFAGVVSERDVSVGDVIGPGSPMFTVVDASRLQLEATVPADQIAAVKVGDPVSFTLNGYSGRTFDGSIVRVSPVADATTRQVQVFTEIKNPDNRIVGGLFATGRIVTQSERGLVAPMGALDTRYLRPSVLRIRHGNVERVDVGLGLRDQVAEIIEISSGVSAGDTLLLAQAQGLTPGTPVRVAPPTGDTAQR
jgi:membrane fusion protein, multidrug efflux system